MATRVTEKLFWSRVQKSDGCWNYIPPRSPVGIDYARLHYAGKYWPCNRLAWFLSYGDSLEDLVVCHKCDNPQCVRPDHLFLGTLDCNNKDKAKKGRARNGGAKLRKLSDEQILEALKKHYDDRVTLDELSKEYGIGVRKLTLWFGRMRRKYGIEKKRWIPDIDNNFVINMRDSGASLQKIATHFGVSRGTITKIIQQGPTVAAEDKS